MEKQKKAFIKAELIDGGARIQNEGTNYQTLLMMALLINSLKNGELTNEDDSKSETFKQIVDFIWKRPKDATRALIQIISVDGELDSLFKSEKENN